MSEGRASLDLIVQPARYSGVGWISLTWQNRAVPAPSKKYQTIEQQVNLLRSRGLELDGEPERWLRSVNYYRLSGYWYIYRQLAVPQEGKVGRSDQFEVGTKFSSITDLYEFDRKLRTLLRNPIHFSRNLRPSSMALGCGSSRDPGFQTISIHSASPKPAQRRHPHLGTGRRSRLFRRLQTFRRHES